MLVLFHHFCSSQGNLEKSNISSFVLLSTHQSVACISKGNDACNFSVLTNYTYCILKGRVEWTIKFCLTGLLQLCKKYLCQQKTKQKLYTQWSQDIVLMLYITYSECKHWQIFFYLELIALVLHSPFWVNHIHVSLNRGFAASLSLKSITVLLVGLLYPVL